MTFMSGYITFEERLEIESIIFQRCSFGEIAKKINKDRSTISREIRRHSVIEKSGCSGFGFNACVHKETCKMGMVCGDKCVKTSCKLCRSYEEYQKFLNKKTDIHPAQMDSVIGTVGGKVLLTIIFLIRAL